MAVLVYERQNQRCVVGGGGGRGDAGMDALEGEEARMGVNRRGNLPITLMSMSAYQMTLFLTEMSLNNGSREKQQKETQKLTSWESSQNH